jgi:Fe-S cluster biogenesis protein NfuA
MFAFAEAISHALGVREAVQRVIDEILRPLLEKDASGIELIDVSADEVRIRVTGRAAFGVGSEFVRSGVIEPALRKVVGETRAIQIEKAVPRPKRRA